MYQKSSRPQYADFPEPAVENRDQVLISVKAAALKHIDRSRARGTHYSVPGDISRAEVIGGDGIGLLDNGRGCTL